jgi:hypothetical protein
MLTTIAATAASVFVVRADEKLTAFAELKSATWAATKRPNYGGL